MMTDEHTDPELSAIEREKIIPLREVARLRGTHIDTIKRNEPHHIVRLSERRLGMRLKHALLLSP
jgi:hypothetical protein